GASAEFDANLGVVRENGSMILTVSNVGEIVFPPNPDEILLPIEIVTALFDASTRFDSVARAVIVNRGGPLAETVRVGAEHSFAEFYQVDYDYNLNSYSSFANHNLNLNVTGRIADGRFTLVSGLTGSSLGRMTPRNGKFTFDRANGQRYIAGDFGSGTELQFLSSNIRGAAVQVNVGDNRI